MAWQRKLCGLAEAAIILEVSDTRVGQFSRDDENFPAEIDSLRCGRVWDYDQMVEYADHRKALLAAKQAARGVQDVILQRVLAVPEMVPGPQVEQP
jgi:hypothetical protein